VDLREQLFLSPRLPGYYLFPSSYLSWTIKPAKMKKFAYNFPIHPEKIEDWLEFVNEINTSRNEEFSEMHARIGVTRESWYLKKGKDTTEVIVYTEAENENFLVNFKNDDSEFSNWFRQKVSELQPVNLDESTEMPQLVLDWKE
jgi:hypothetical protein